MPTTARKIIDITETGAPIDKELTIALETLFFIVVKARQYDVKVSPVESDPASNPADMQQREVLEDYKDDPTASELKGAINALNNDEQADLVALVWLGRGDFDVSEWDQARALAFQEQHHVARYLLGTPLLGDLLEEGASALGYSLEDFEIDRL
jgi:hypothetical protein